MILLAIVGYGDAGKTGLIERLIPELKSRGRSVAVIKHCRHGFDLDREGTDSWRFKQAGSQGVALLSPQRLAVLYDQGPPHSAAGIAKSYFSNLDVVLVEGGKNEPGIPKIWIEQGGDKGLQAADREDVVALVAGRDINCAKPVFRPAQVRELADFILSYKWPEG